MVNRDEPNGATKPPPILRCKIFQTILRCKMLPKMQPQILKQIVPLTKAQNPQCKLQPQILNNKMPPQILKKNQQQILKKKISNKYWRKNQQQILTKKLATNIEPNCPSAVARLDFRENNCRPKHWSLVAFKSIKKRKKCKIPDTNSPVLPCKFQ